MIADTLETTVQQHLDLRYRQRAEKLWNLKLRDLLRQNPYLPSLMGTNNTGEIVKRLIENHLSSFEDWWHELTTNPKFCLDAIALMRDESRARYLYEVELANAQNRLTLQLIEQFCDVDYRLDWEKLLLVNSVG